MSESIMDLCCCCVDNIEGVMGPKSLYHYTDLNAIEGILGEDGLNFRFTHFEDFEDITEGTVLSAILDTQLKKLCKAKEISEDFRSFFLQQKSIAKEQFYYVPKSDSPTPEAPASESNLLSDYDAYVCCFCTERDSEYMKKEYAENGGAIELSTQDCKLYDIEKLNPGIMKLDWRRIIYGENKQREYVNNFILDAYAAYKEYKNQDGSLDQLAEIIQTWLNCKSLEFKNKEYKEEEELRMLAYVPRKLPDDCPQERPVEHKPENKPRYINVRFDKKILQAVYFEVSPNAKLIERIRGTYHVNNLWLKDKKLP